MPSKTITYYLTIYDILTYRILVLGEPTLAERFYLNRPFEPDPDNAGAGNGHLL